MNVLWSRSPRLPRSRPGRTRHIYGSSAAKWALLCGFCGISLAAWTQSAPVGLDALKTNAAEAGSHGDLADALRLYQEAVTLEPGDAESWWFLGNLQYDSDQYEPAKRSLDHFIRLSHDAVAAFALRGLCEFEISAYPEALQDIQRAISLGAANQPRNAQILLYHEALLLTRLGRFDEAIAKYVSFINKGIVNTDVATGIGLAGLRLPLLSAGLDPAKAQLALAVGQAGIQILTGGITKGRQAALQLARAYSNQPYIHYFCGYLLFTIDPDQAEEEFKLELADDPDNALAHVMLAWGAEFRGQYAAALPEAQKAVAEQPAMPMAQLVLGRALIETSDVSGGLTHLNEVVASDPANLEAHLSLVRAYSKLGRKDEARSERLLCLQLVGQETNTHASP